MGWKTLRDALHCISRMRKVFYLFPFVVANKDCRLCLRGLRVVSANWQQVFASSNAGGLHLARVTAIK